MTAPRLTPERLNELLVEYGIAMQEVATSSLSPAPDAKKRHSEWMEKAAQIAREIREGVFPS